MRYFQKVRPMLYALVIVLTAGSFLSEPSTTLAVQVTQLAVSGITATTVTVSWKTDVSVQGLVDYGTTEDFGTIETNETPTTTHSITLAGLQPNTKYYFRVYVDDGADEQAIVDGEPFTTLADNSTPPNPPVPVPPSPVPPAPNPSPPTPTPLPPSTGPVYPTGTLAKEANNSTIYFLMSKDRVKIPFANGEAFLGLGYKFANVKTLNLSAYRSPQTYFIDSANIAHPWGSLTVWKDGTVYYMAPDGAIPIASMDVINANGLGGIQIAPMNRYDEMEWDRNGNNLPILKIGDSRLL